MKGFWSIFGVLPPVFLGSNAAAGLEALHFLMNSLPKLIGFLLESLFYPSNGNGIHGGKLNKASHSQVRPPRGQSRKVSVSQRDGRLRFVKLQGTQNANLTKSSLNKTKNFFQRIQWIIIILKVRGNRLYSCEVQSM